MLAKTQAACFKQCILADLVSIVFFKFVGLRMDCVLVGTNLRQMTLTGCVVRDAHHHTTEVLHLDTAVIRCHFLNNFKQSFSERKNAGFKTTDFVICCCCFSFLLGFYMYIETSSPRSYGDEAKLLFSPTRSAIGKLSCLKFYYHI